MKCTRPSGLGEIDGLNGTSKPSCALTGHFCTGKPLRIAKPTQDEWYAIRSDLCIQTASSYKPLIADYWDGASCRVRGAFSSQCQVKVPKRDYFQKLLQPVT